MDVHPPACLAGQSNGKLDASLLWSTPGLAGGPTIRLVEPAARAWRALTAAASAAGHTLKATSSADSYRTYAQQVATFTARYQVEPIPERPFRLWDSDNSGTPEKWWQKPNTAPAAVPGRSNHGWGLAVDTGEERDGDTGTESLDAATLDWLVANELRFGFSHELQVEPWHIRYCTGDAIPAAVLAYEAQEETLQSLVRITNDPVDASRVWLSDRMTRRLVKPAWLADDPANTAAVIAGSRPADGAIVDIGAYAGGPLGNNSKVYQAAGDPEVWGAVYPPAGGSAPAGPVDLTAASVEAVAKAVADEQHDRLAD